MPSAYDIAASQYQRPDETAPNGSSSAVGYSCHAEAILNFLVKHRVALASQIHRALPDLLKSERSARRHLQSLATKGVEEVRILTYEDPRKPNVYLITDAGMDHARDFMPVIPESIPSSHRESSGDHILHELLITEVVVARMEFYRNQTDFEQLWEERFGFHKIRAFADIIPDHLDAYRTPRGCLIDFTEVFTGERSATKVKRKLQAYADWSETDEAKHFLKETYRYFGVAHPNPVFRINILAHNRNLVGADFGWERQVLNATFAVPETLQKRIWTTTNAALKRANGIDSPVWHCAAKLVPHRSHWHEMPKSKRSKFLSTILAQVPTYQLFTFAP